MPGMPRGDCVRDKGVLRLFSRWIPIRGFQSDLHLEIELRLMKVESTSIPIRGFQGETAFRKISSV